MIARTILQLKNHRVNRKIQGQKNKGRAGLTSNRPHVQPVAVSSISPVVSSFSQLNRFYSTLTYTSSPSPPISPVISSIPPSSIPSTTPSPSTLAANSSVSHPPKASTPPFDPNDQMSLVTFPMIWQKLEEEVGKENLIFPMEIVYLLGAPGSGYVFVFLFFYLSFIYIMYL